MEASEALTRSMKARLKNLFGDSARVAPGSRSCCAGGHRIVVAFDSFTEKH